MRYSLILVLLCYTLTLSGTTYYIDPAGNNTNNGSISSPWKTLAYACSKATTSGDIIHVNAGTFIETTQCVLASGVSIIGTGVTSIIKSSYAGSIYSGLIKLQSPTGNPINGNQSISAIKLDGNSLTGICAITIEYRSNVEIHHCTIVDFAHRGIAHITEDGYPFNNGAGPTYNYSVGNSVHDCIISNCSNMDNAVNDPEFASVWAFAQQGFLFYNNTCTETSRPVNSSSGNGIPLKGNYLRGIKVHDNTFTKLDNNGPSWHFFLETWHYEADCEIYNNVFNGSAIVDICDVRKGAGSYGLKIYNNQFLVAAQTASSAHGTQAIDFEEWGTVQSVYVYNNHFKNVNNGIWFDAQTGNAYDNLIDGVNVLFQDIFIYYNIFEGIGATDISYYAAIDIKPEGSNSNVVWNNIHILNNDITAGASPIGTGILVETGGTMTNIFIRNNIIRGTSGNPVYFSYNMASTITGNTIHAQNNLYYLNGTNTIGYSGVTISGLDNSANTAANPMFVSASDFHLSSNSPAVATGIHITTPTILTDYDDRTIDNIPEIGAFEYGTSTTTPVVPVYVSSAIANATPSLLEMTYNQAFANIIPSASSLSVLVNSVARTVNAVVISGTKVQLTLASPIVYGDVVSVSYAQPSANPLQTSSGGLAVALVAQSVTNNVNSINPVYVSSAIGNTTPSLLEMTYNLTLANIVPVASSFTVLVNSVVRTINTVVISGTKIQLTLASPIVNGNVVTVSYTQPSANPVQTSSGGKAITLGAQTVTNNVIGVNPVYVSSAIANATPSLLEMTYNQTLASTVPAAASFTVLVNSVARTINTVVISGSKVQLTLASPIVYGNVVTVSYSKPSTNPLQTTAGVQAITIGAQTVTNSVIGITPVYVSSVIAGATPSLLEMTYNQTLASIIPAVSSFTVLVNSVVRTINTVVISGTKVQLTLVSRIASGDIVTVSYIKPAGNPIQTTAGGIATGFTNQTVINNCINVAPTIAITSPVMNSSFASLSNITITASALDADGSVSMVEYYNGSVKLGSNSVAPYSYTWNNVTAGNYSLTVIATDNLNAKTTSSAVSISVISGTHTSNKHPFIRIFNPRKGLTYDNLSTIEIDADASDPDGTISKVEFYNGQSKLVELTSAPYIYTWKDVVAGTYTITAIATDNLNDTTISSPIEFVVGAIAKYDANSDIINLYPNPNNGHFSIDFINPLKNEKSEIIITDLSGKQVYNGPVLKEELSKQFDLSDIRSGMYVMMIKDKEILVTKKFIKK